MNIEDILEKLSNKSGQNINACWSRRLKTRKNVLDTVEKITCCKVRTGIKYDNQLIVKMRREIGERPEKNQGLPWGEWVQFPYHITHNGRDYIRLYPASDKFAERSYVPTVEYYLNGNKVSKNDIEPLCLASEFSSGKADCFTVKAENIVSFG